MRIAGLNDKLDTWARSAEGLARFVGPFAILMMLFLAFYLGGMSSFTISVDDEYAALRIHPTAWLPQGRWTMYLLETIISQPVVPYFPLMLFGLCAAAAYLMASASLRFVTPGFASYLLFFLFSAFPTLFFILAFAANVSGIAVGVLCTGAAMLIFSSVLNEENGISLRPAKNAWKAVAQVALATVAVGCYQSFALAIVVGYGAVFVSTMIYRERYDTRFIIRANLYILFVFLVSLLPNYLLIRAVVTLLPPAAGREYGIGFVRLDTLMEAPGRALMSALRDYADVYLGSPAVYGFRHATFPLLILAGIAALVVRSAERGVAAAAFVLAYLVGMTLVPFAFHVLSGGSVPYRTLVAVPLVFWFLAASAAFSRWSVVRVGAIVLAAVVGLQSLYTLSAFEAGRRLVYQHDVNLAAQVHDRIARAHGFDQETIYAVDIFGAPRFHAVYPTVQGSTIGASLFEWGGGETHRIIWFMTLLGYPNMNAMTAKDRKAFLPEMLQMPVWPREGSVRIIGTKVLVRLGEQPGLPHRPLMPAVEDARPILFDLASAPADSVAVRNAEVISQDDGKLHIAAGDDAMVIVSAGKPNEFRTCKELSVRAIIFTLEDETAQLYFIPAGGSDFTEANSSKLGVSQGNPVEFVIASANGFEDRLRLDPSFVPSQAAIDALTVRCGSPPPPR